MCSGLYNCEVQFIESTEKCKKNNHNGCFELYLLVLWILFNCIGSKSQQIFFTVDMNEYE